MERDIMPDYAVEAFYQYLIPESVFAGTEKPEEEVEPCVVFSKEGAPHLSGIKKEVAARESNKNYFNDEISMTAPSTRVVFVLKKA